MAFLAFLSTIWPSNNNIYKLSKPSCKCTMLLSDVHALINLILKNKKGLVFSRQIKRHSVHNNLGLIIVVMIVVRSAVAQWWSAWLGIESNQRHHGRIQRGVDRGSGSPLKNHKNIGFSGNIDVDP